MVLGPGYWWIQVDEDGEYTGHICSAWYGLADKPVEGIWVLVKRVEVEEEPKKPLGFI